MFHKYILISLALFCFVSEEVTSQSPLKIVIGEKIELESNILDITPELSIYLPKSYESSNKSYPVLYIVRDFFHFSSGAVDYLSKSRQIPEMIVVNFTNNKQNEVPTVVPGRESRTGGSEDLLNFMIKELIPFVESKYRTVDYRVLFSQSWGAVFCMQALLTEPDVFNAAIASSPWLIYDSEAQYMVKSLPSVISSKKYNSNFLFFTGGDQPELTPALEDYAHKLKSLAPEGLRWEYDPMAGEDHASLPYKTIYDGLVSLYLPWSIIPDDVLGNGEQSLDQYSAILEKIYGYDIGISVVSLFAGGQKFRMKKEYNKAIFIFKFAIRKFPDNHLSYYRLARVYDDLDNFEDAIIQYEIALKLAVEQNSANQHTYRDYLEKVKKRIKD